MLSLLTQKIKIISNPIKKKLKNWERFSLLISNNKCHPSWLQICTSHIWGPVFIFSRPQTANSWLRLVTRIWWKMPWPDTYLTRLKWSELCGFFSNKNAYNVIDLKWHFTSTSFQIHILINLKSIHTLHQQGKKMPYHNLFKSFKLKIQTKPLLLKTSIEMSHLYSYFFKFLWSYVF